MVRDVDATCVDSEVSLVASVSIRIQRFGGKERWSHLPFPGSGGATPLLIPALLYLFSHLHTVQLSSFFTSIRRK
jgi:hypothetical protein